MAFAVMVMSAKAQIDEDINVTAHGDAERKIIFTERLSVLPNIVDTSFNAYPVKYRLIPVDVRLHLIPQSIAPVKLTVLEPLDQLYSGYIKAGIGNYLMPYGDLYYSSVRNKSKQWGINLKHHSSQGGIKDVGYNGFNQNKAAIDYQRFYYKYSLEAKASYERNSMYFYGYNPEQFKYLNKDNTHQAFNVAQGSLTYQTHYKDSLKINNRMGVEYRFMNNLYTVNENYAKIHGELTKLMEKEVYGLDYSLDFNGLSQPNYNKVAQADPLEYEKFKTNNAILKINPHIRTGGENWSVRAGLAIQSDMSNVAKFHFYPDAEADFSLFNDIFIPYLGISGGLERNSFYSMTAVNPFILSNSEMKTTNNKYDIHFGIRGSISSKISFNLGASVKKFNDYALYVNDTVWYNAANVFKPIYYTLTKTTISAQTTYAQGEKLKVYLRGEYHLFDVLREAYAWNEPNFNVSLSGVYDLADKIIVRGDVFVVGERNIPFQYDETTLELLSTGFKLKPFVDFNLGFEYRYTKRLSAFLNFNNILNQKYQNWNFYKVQGFNVLGGMTYRF